MKNYIYLALSLILSLQPLFSYEWHHQNEQGIAVQLLLEPDRTEFHEDPITLSSLTVSHPEGYVLDTNRLKENAFQKLTPQAVVNVESIDVESLTSTEARVTFHLSPLVFGDLYFSLHPLRFTTPEGSTVRFPLPILNAQILIPDRPPHPGVTQDLLPLHDSSTLRLSRQNQERFIHGLSQGEEAAQDIENSFQERQFPWPILTFLTLAAVLYAGYRFILKAWRSRYLKKESSVDPRSEALQALRELAQEHLPEKGMYDPYYVALTEIVRRYIENRYHIDAPEQTTEEFLRFISTEHTFDPEMQGLIQEFLVAADMVKFAQHAPSTEDCEQAHHHAVDFVST